MKGYKEVPNISSFSIEQVISQYTKLYVCDPEIFADLPVRIWNNYKTAI